MSSKEQARRVAVEVAFAGVDISQSVRKYIKSLTFIDNEEDEADDLQIKLHDRDGLWLERWLGEMVDASAVATAQDGASASGATSYIVTAKSGIRVRSGPGLNHKRIGKLVCGATVQVKSIEKGWATIVYNGSTAYVSAEWIKPKGASAAKTSAGSTAGGGTYTVVRGDSLWAIAKKQLGDGTRWKEIRDLNGIGSNNLILPGQVLKLPGGAAGDGEAAAEEPQGLRIEAAILRENWNGDGTDRVLDCGSFELDSVEASGPPDEVTIKATSLPFSTPIRQTKKNKAWEGYRLSGIAKEIGDKNGMTVIFECENDPYYERVEQFQTSDIDFLSGLCHDAGASLKITGYIIVVFDQAAYESKDEVRTIRKGDKTYTKYKVSRSTADTKYAICRVRYTDPDTGKVIEGIAKTKEQQEKEAKAAESSSKTKKKSAAKIAEEAEKEKKQTLEITAKVSSIAEAQALAAKRLRLHNKFAMTAVFTFPGDPDLMAGLTVMLEGWGAFDGKYIIKQSKHTVSKGYTTQITLRRALEGY